MTAGPGAMEGLDARLVAAMRSSYRTLRVVGMAHGVVVTGWAVGVVAQERGEGDVGAGGGAGASR
jgi:hypothetical protein